jgi:hypothetical protein
MSSTGKGGKFEDLIKWNDEGRANGQGDVLENNQNKSGKIISIYNPKNAIYQQLALGEGG